MVEKEYLISRLIGYHKRLNSDVNINIKILTLVNFYDFAFEYKDALISISNIEETLVSITESLNLMINQESLHKNLINLLIDRINKYYEIYC
jgi:hypothetical protein